MYRYYLYYSFKYEPKTCPHQSFKDTSRIQVAFKSIALPNKENVMNLIDFGPKHMKLSCVVEKSILNSFNHLTLQTLNTILPHIRIFGFFDTSLELKLNQPYLKMVI